MNMSHPSTSHISKRLQIEMLISSSISFHVNSHFLSAVVRTHNTSKTEMNNALGQEMLKLFVVANSLVMFLTLAWPQMKGVFDIIGEFVNDKFGSTGELF